MDDLPTLDTHAHVWDRTCEIVAGGSHAPAYEAPLDTYLQLLDANGIARAVLVQPSFLGADNCYLLDALDRHPDRLRGIAVLDPQTGAAELDDLTARGVIGLRLNMMHRNAPDLAQMTTLLQAAGRRGWWVEVHASGAMWPGLLPHLADARLMVDHFGRPSGSDCPGLAALLGRDPATTCVKLSAPYRQTAPDLPAIARRLIAHLGPDRCLWGSDWPWTQHEGRHDYARSRQWLADWTTPADQAEMAAVAPALSGF